MLLCCMKTIKDVFASYRQGLDNLYGPQETDAITLTVLEELTGFSRAKIKAFPDDLIQADSAEKLRAILDELKTGKPVQYILGYTEFYGLQFWVNPATLIPRPETEELVDWVIKESKKVNGGSKKLSILDIGTGSGCIAITLKKHLPDAGVSAIDISGDALKTAIRNAVINEVEVDFIADSILEIKSDIKNREFDIIISNPPYVTLVDKLQMHQNVVDFEPHTALFVPENDPLVFYRAIADFAVTHLVPGGKLFFEINESFGAETVQLLRDKGFDKIELRQDMSGRDRMIRANSIAG